LVVGGVFTMLFSRSGGLALVGMEGVQGEAASYDVRHGSCQRGMVEIAFSRPGFSKLDVKTIFLLESFKKIFEYFFANENTVCKS
jgi:hypothetical protein